MAKDPAKSSSGSTPVLPDMFDNSDHVTFRGHRLQLPRWAVPVALAACVGLAAFQAGQATVIKPDPVTAQAEAMADLVDATTVRLADGDTSAKVNFTDDAVNRSLDDYALPSEVGEFPPITLKAGERRTRGQYEALMAQRRKAFGRLIEQLAVRSSPAGNQSTRDADARYRTGDELTIGHDPVGGDWVQRARLSVVKTRELTDGSYKFDPCGPGYSVEVVARYDQGKKPMFQIADPVQFFYEGADKFVVGEKYVSGLSEITCEVTDTDLPPTPRPRPRPN